MTSITNTIISSETGLPVSDAVCSEVKPKSKQKRHKQGMLCKGQRIRLYPTFEQAQKLKQWIGTNRFVWNWALHQIQEYDKQYKSDLKNNVDVSGKNKTLSVTKISKNFTNLKKQSGFEWLETVPRTVPTNALQHLQKTISAYYDGLSGKRAGESPGKPKFKSKHSSNDTATFQVDPRHKHPLDALRHTLKIPGLGPVKVVLSEPCAGDISSITIRNKGNKWFAVLTLINVSPDNVTRLFSKDNVKQNISSKVKQFPDISIEDNRAKLFQSKEGLAALDASVVCGAVATTDGNTTFSLFNQNVLRSNEKHEQRKTKYQKAFARKFEQLCKQKGLVRDANGQWPKDFAKQLKSKNITNSNRMIALKNNIAVLDAKEVFRKSDAIHKFTSQLVKENHTIVVETLMLHSMAQSALGKGFRRRMHEACMGEIIRQLKYKCEWYNRSILFADKWFPSSKRCSNTACHERNKFLLLKDRLWVCQACKTKHVRDDTAAFNLWQEGWRLLDEYFQKNDSGVLAAGSVVRGTQGMIAQSLQVKLKTKPQKEKQITSQKRNTKSLPQVFSKSSKQSKLLA